MMAVAVLAHKFISAIDRWRSIGKRDPLMRLANRKDAHRPTKIDDLFIRSDDIFIRFIVFRVRHSIKIVQFTFSSRIIVSCPLFFVCVSSSTIRMAQSLPLCLGVECHISGYIELIIWLIHLWASTVRPGRESSGSNRRHDEAPQNYSGAAAGSFSLSPLCLAWIRISWCQSTTNGEKDILPPYGWIINTGQENLLPA